MTRPLLLTLEYPPQYGGVARYLEGEVKASSVPIVVSHVHGKRWLNLIWRARPQFKKEKCDYLWISHVLPVGYVALVWKWLYKTRYRVYLHGLDLVLPRQSKWKTFWVKIILQNADEIITNSQATAKLLDYYGLRRDAIHRASVQHPKIEKINAEQYKPIGEGLRQKYNLNSAPILLTVSRLVKRKGIDLVLRALSEVWKHIPNLAYVVVGEGGEEHELKSLVANNPRVMFVGSVSEEEKYAWLAACDCFILTPVDDPNDFEGYGIVYKEAQMFGKSVIGSKVGGVPEAVGDRGVLVEPGNVRQITEAIIDVIKKDTRYKKQTRHNTQIQN